MPIIGLDLQPGLALQTSRLKLIIEKEFPGIFQPTEVCLNVIAQLRIKDIANCTFLTFIGSPASRKTTMLSWFHGLDVSYYSDDFSPNSFHKLYLKHPLHKRVYRITTITEISLRPHNLYRLQSLDGRFQPETAFRFALFKSDSRLS